MARNGIDLNFPQTDTIHVVLSTLNDTDQIIQTLKCKFTDDNFDETQELRDNILIGIASGNISKFEFRNSCRSLEKHNQCFDFFLQCNSGQQKKIKRFEFNTLLPLTVVEAHKISASITSNEHIESLSFIEYHDGRQLIDGMFHEVGTFDVIFEAVLNNATIKIVSLHLIPSSLPIFVERDCFSTSTLSTNVTLRALLYGSISSSEIHENTVHIDEGINQIANVLKVNKGLQSLYFLGSVITNAGYRYLVDSMHHNSTLLKMDFSDCAVISNENEEERNKRIVLQSKINFQIQVNKIWNRCNRKHINARKGDKKWTNMDMLPVKVYPYLLLETIAKKPSLLFLLLQKQNPVLFDQHPS